MEILITAFNTVLYRPLFNFLVLLYQYIPGQDFGIAVIILTVIVRLAVSPAAIKSIKSQQALQKIQPKLKKIQKKYKNDKEKQAQATMELYKKEKVNPLSGCLPLLIQLPILLALFRVFWRGFGPEQMSFLYSFVPDPGVINTTFLGIINLAQSCTAEIGDQLVFLWPNIILVILVGIFQFIQMKITTSQISPSSGEGQMAQFSGMMQKQMVYFFPAFAVLILWRLPAAIGVYWLITTFFSIAQYRLISVDEPKTIEKKQNK